MSSRHAISFQMMERGISLDESITNYSIREDSHISLRIDGELGSSFFSMVRLAGWQIEKTKHYDVATKLVIKPRLSQKDGK